MSVWGPLPILGYDTFVSRDNTICNGKLTKGWTATVEILPEGCPIYLDEDDVDEGTGVELPEMNGLLSWFMELFQ